MGNEKAEVLKQEGNELVRQKKWPEAAKKYKKAAKLDPKCAVYWSNLACCYDNMDFLIEFKDAAKKCVDVDPSFVKGYYRLAKAHERFWEYEDQLRVLGNGLEVDPGNGWLKEMMDKTETLLRNRKSQFTESILKVPNSELEFLGGLHESRKSKIEKETFYGRLERPPLPPLSKKYSNPSNYDPGVRKLIQALYNEDVKIKWYRGFFNLEVEGYLNLEDSAPAIRYKDTKFGCLDVYKMDCFCPIEVHPIYHRLLKVDEIESLKIVFMSRFLREKGHLLDKDFLVLIGAKLTRDCRKNSLYKASADVQLTISDICANYGYENEAHSKVYTAEELECAKKFEDAANIYAELALQEEKFANSPLTPAMAHSYAALAFKRAGDFIRAEAEYATTIRLLMPEGNWDEEGELLESTVRNMVIFYSEVDRLVNSGALIDESHREIQKTGYVFNNLMMSAGFPLDDLPMNTKLSGCMLKPEYDSREKAFPAIVNAAMAETVEEYQDRLWECLRSRYWMNFRIPRSGSSNPMSPSEYVKDQKEYDTKTARGYLKNTGAGYLWTCMGCGKRSNKKLQCPCLTVVYCSKECQVSHWPVHTKICPRKKR